MWFDPFVAQVDVMCGTETGFGGTCQVIAAITNQNAAFQGDVQGEFGVKRDSYWPHSVAAMVIAGLILIILAVQLVAPTRRWQIRLPRRRRKTVGGEA